MPFAAEEVKFMSHPIDKTAYNNMEKAVQHKGDDIEANQTVAKPTEWPLWYKWVMVALVAMMNMLDAFATMTVVPAVPQIFTEFHVTNAVYSVLVVSIWELGEGIGPFFVAPLSELFGRVVVYHIGNCLFTLCLVASALSTNMSMLIAFRFLNGRTTTSLALAPSIVGDIFIQEERGSVIAVAVSFLLVGPLAAPIVGGYVAEALGWRWTIWVSAIAVGTLTLVSLVSFRETYYPVILGRQTRSLVKSITSVSHDAQSRLWNKKIRSLLRPLRMLFFSPAVFLVSLYTAATYGMSYLIVTTLTEIFEASYGFSQGAVGLLFLGQAIGSVLGVIFYGTSSDAYLKYRALRRGGTQPESRLLFIVIGSGILPIGFFMYGWTLQYHVFWIVPIIGTTFVGINTVLAILPTENYLVDVYGDYSASAIAIGVVMRAIIGAFLPLAGPSLYASLGYGWGNGLLGFLALIFIPLVVLLFMMGSQFRGNSKHWKN